MVRHHPPPNRVLLRRRRRRHRVFLTFLPATLHLDAIASRSPRRGARDRLEHPILTFLDAVGHPPRLVGEQAYDPTLR